MAARRVLIVEDDETQRRVLDALLKRAGYVVEWAGDGEAATNRVLDPDAAKLDVVLLDLGLPKRDGFEVLKAIRPVHPRLPVIVLTADGSQRRIIDAMKAGAQDFMVKPASADRVKTALDNVLTTSPATQGNTNKQRQVEDSAMDSLIGNSPAMATCKAHGLRAAHTLIPVLIEGESGVGKEVFARAIHQASSRRHMPFVAVNCGAIPENLVESTLFGHVKGAFTGAVETRKGKFVEANGGTLFLDEVGELPLSVQPKLLRALQERMIDAVGSSASQRVDIRVLSATNRSLADHVADGQFREDLFYRLNVFHISLPPLRDRVEDIPDLARFFLRSIAKAEGLPVPDLPTDRLAALQRHPWPGNVRELQNFIFRALVLSEGGPISLETLPPNSGSAAETPSPHTVPPQPGSAGEPSGARTIEVVTENGTIRTLAAIEEAAIAHAIEHCGGRMAEVARELGISRSTLYRKLRLYGLEDKP